jgi:micrococcal nuclease
MYEYHARCERVVDGDTIDVILDLGLGVFKRERLRLLGIDTPEVYGRVEDEERARGRAASEFVSSFIEGRDIIVRTFKDRKGKYGRYLAVVFYRQAGTTFNVNKHIVDNGHAVEAEGWERAAAQRID